MATTTLPEAEVQPVSKSATKYVYFFGGGKADGNGKMKDELGGKGAGLAEMTNAGLPVPPGFTIATEACREYMRKGGVSQDVDRQMDEALANLEKLHGQKLGKGQNPLLVSVRSGAKFSMPGMMDTILNLGINDVVVESLSQLTGNARFAWDAYRRFIAMYGNVVGGIEKNEFEHILEAQKHKRNIKLDTDLKVHDLQEIVIDFKKLYANKAGEDFPQDPLKQLEGARNAVFESWMNPRAIYYRKQNKIADDLGTAVNVQSM